MKAEKRWYAVYTKPRSEKKVADLLAKRKIESFCPLNKVIRQWSDRKKTILEPLFTSYVFVHIAEEEHLLIRQTDGVVNLVYWLGAPAIIRDEEISAIKDFIAEHSNVQLEKMAINVADRVRIIDGLLVQREGEVLEIKNKTVKLFLPSLGYTMLAEVAKENIEALNYAQSVYSPVYYPAKVG